MSLLLRLIYPSFSLAWWEDTDFLIEVLNTLVMLMSWFWIIPSVIAGTLMTNQFVYGEFMHLDMYLWTLWNMMKNFANFALGFIFLFVIFKTFFKWEPWSVLKSYLPKIWLAWILIQATWFLVAVIIDITLVAMAAVSALPGYFVDSGDGEYVITMPDRCDFFKWIKDAENIDSMCQWDQEVDLTAISATAVDASWPLLYFGFNVLQLQDFNHTSVTSWDNLTVEFLVKLFISLLFTIPILILMIINLIRIFWLWMFIVFSPFVVLDAVFGNAVTSKMEWATKKLTLANFVWLAFQPVIVIWMLWIILIFVTWLMQVFQIDENEDQNDIVAANLSEVMNIVQDDGDAGWHIKLEGEEWWAQIWVTASNIKQSWNYVGGFLWYIIISIFVSFMVWSLIKVSFKTSDITSWAAQSMFNFAEESMKTIPIVPWTNYSVGALQRAQKSFWWEMFKSIQGSQASKVEDYIDYIYWWEGLSSEEYTTLQRRVSQVSSGDPWAVTRAFSTLRNETEWPLVPNKDPRLEEFIESITKKYAEEILDENNRRELLNEDGSVNWSSHKFRWFINHMMAWNSAPNKSQFKDLTTSSDYTDVRTQNLRDI